MKNDLRATALMMLVAAVCAAGCDTAAGPTGTPASAGAGGHAGGAAGTGEAAGTGGFSGIVIGTGGTTGQAGHGGTAACPCPSETNGGIGPARQPLACLCNSEAPSATCGLTLATYDEVAQCKGPSGGFFGVTRWTGCGKVAYGKTQGFGLEEVTFDAASGALLGVEQESDAGFGACSVARYVYGDSITSCPDAKACLLCGNYNLEMSPPCN
jgi:hypothetical protein